jgi:hypothetical protein
MLRIIILTILVACTSNCFTQNNFEIDILNIEMQYFDVKNDTLKQKLILKKMDLLIANNVLDERLFKEVKRVKSAYLDKIESANFFWNAAIISYLNKETNHASNYLNRYFLFQKEETIPFKLMYFLTNQKIDSLKSIGYYKELCLIDSVFIPLQEIYTLENFELKGKKLLLNSGIIIPGLGAMLNGNILKGLVSLSLNVLSFYAIRTLILQKLYINSFGWGFNLFGKFYLGNLRMTENLVNKKENNQKNKLATDCELILKEILEKYPFEFK